MQKIGLVMAQKGFRIMHLMTNILSILQNMSVIFLFSLLNPQNLSFISLKIKHLRYKSDLDKNYKIIISNTMKKNVSRNLSFFFRNQINGTGQYFARDRLT